MYAQNNYSHTNNHLVNGHYTYPGKYPGIVIIKMDNQYFPPGVQAFTNCKNKIFIRRKPELGIVVKSKTIKNRNENHNDRENKSVEEKIIEMIGEHEKRFSGLQEMSDKYSLSEEEVGRLVERFILQHEHEHILDPMIQDEHEIDKRAMRKLGILRD